MVPTCSALYPMDADGEKRKKLTRAHTSCLDMPHSFLCLLCFCSVLLFPFNFFGGCEWYLHGATTAVDEPRRNETEYKTKGDTSTILTLSPPNAPSLLHLGKAADYGQCEARKGDGRRCRAFVDKRQLASSTSAVVCTAHQGMAMDRLRVARPQLAPGGRFAPGPATNNHHKANPQDPWADLESVVSQASKPDSRTAGAGGDRNTAYSGTEKNKSDMATAVQPSPATNSPTRTRWTETNNSEDTEDWESIFRASLHSKKRSSGPSRLPAASHSGRGQKGEGLDPWEQAESYNSHRQHHLERRSFVPNPQDETQHLYDVRAHMGRGKADLQASHAKRAAQEDLVEKMDYRRQPGPRRHPAGTMSDPDLLRPSGEAQGMMGNPSSAAGPRAAPMTTALRRYDDPEDEEEQMRLAAEAYEQQRAQGDVLSLYRQMGPTSGASKIMEQAQKILQSRRTSSRGEDVHKRKQVPAHQDDHVNVPKRARRRGPLSPSSSSSSSPSPPRREAKAKPGTEQVAEPEQQGGRGVSATACLVARRGPQALQTSMMRQIGFDPFAGRPVNPTSNPPACGGAAAAAGAHLAGGGNKKEPGSEGVSNAASRLLARTVSNPTSFQRTPSLRSAPGAHHRNVRPPPGAERTGKQYAYDALYGLTPEDLVSDLDCSEDEVEL